MAQYNLMRLHSDDSHASVMSTFETRKDAREYMRILAKRIEETMANDIRATWHSADSRHYGLGHSSVRWAVSYWVEVNNEAINSKLAQQ